MDGFEGMNEGLHKARSGLIRVLLKTEEGRIKDIIISGDFILIPETYIDLMEEALIGVKVNRERILELLRDFYAKNAFQSPQTGPEDFTEAVMKAAGVERR